MSPDAGVGCRRPRVMREDRPVALTVVELGSTELLGERRAELEQLWLDVWPGTSGRLYAILPGHARRAGFRFLAAQDGRRTVGFAYGYVGGEGEAWHERIARSMTEEQRERWLAPGELEFVELGVHPNRRRRGIGGRLHDELLARAGRRTAVLSTEHDNEAAIAFYERRGWDTIVPKIRIGKLYRVMGREEPAPARL
jgi:ribosomal protein S18 acetylase RimI-like enzyme